MKRIIFLLLLAALYTAQSKAFISHTVESDNGHKYAYYKCGSISVNYVLEIDVSDHPNRYSYASITAYFSNNRSREIQFRPPTDGSYGGLQKVGIITAPAGTNIKRIKLAASGEMVSARSSGKSTVMWFVGSSTVYWW